MSGLFERLQKEIENKQSEGGITALDLAELPSGLRKIMRLMLRELELSYPRLTETMSSFSDDEQFSQHQLDEALDTLVNQSWLTRIGAGEKAIYKVNLRRKAGSNMANGIWNALDSKLKK